MEVKPKSTLPCFWRAFFALPTLFTLFQPADNFIVHGAVADRCLLSGVIQTSHFKGVTTVFDLGRVKTCAHEERAELFSLLSCLDNRRQRFCFPN